MSDDPLGPARTPEGPNQTCALCDAPAHQSRDIENEHGDVVSASFCKRHIEKLEAYTRGEGVEFDA